MKLRITIEDRTYDLEVEVADEFPTPVRYVETGGGSNNSVARLAAPVAASSSGRTPADEEKACRSPLAGVVNEIKVEVGDQVEANQPVLVLEAMKMFTTITSPVAGKVIAVDAAKGDAVKQGQLLMEFE